MKLQQLRYLVEVAKQGLNISEAAEKLFTSQPGISKQIKMLEDELNVQIFVRHGKRMVAITEPGKAIIRSAERILSEARNLKRIASDFSQQVEGHLTIALTSNQAHETLPDVVASFLERYPKVRLKLKQESNDHALEGLSRGEVDLAIITEAVPLPRNLISLACSNWHYDIIVQSDHPLVQQQEALTLEELATWPIICYDFSQNAHSLLRHIFQAEELEPDVVLTILDTEAIKTYVRRGLGVGLIASTAFDPLRDEDLLRLDGSHLFPSSTIQIVLRKYTYLRNFSYDFIALFASELTQNYIESRLYEDSDYSI